MAREQHDYDDIPGTFVFDAERSRQGYGINMFCMSLMKDENRKAFKANEAEYVKQFKLTPEQTEAVLKRDYNRMLELGGNIYFTAKLGATDGHSFQHLAANMTGASQQDYANMMLDGGRNVEGNRSRTGKNTPSKFLSAVRPRSPPPRRRNPRPSQRPSLRQNPNPNQRNGSDTVARIIAGVGSSHVPAIGAALDNGKTEEPYWKRVFSGFEKSQAWMRETKPDVAIVVYNDHASAFSVDMIPTFALGCAPEFPPADEGWGPRPVPVAKGHPALASHIAQSVILDEFDLTICNKMEIDHGMTVPMKLLFGKVDKNSHWPCPVIPLAVNVVMYPPPTGHRCYMLGKAIRRAVESYPDDLRVVIFGTGGLSHQISGPRAGLINSKWDKAFLDNLTKDPQKLVKIPHLDYMREAGAEGIEMVMWLIMRGALDDKVDEVYRFYTVPASNTAVGHIILENRKRKQPPSSTSAPQRVRKFTGFAANTHGVMRGFDPRIPIARALCPAHRDGRD